MNDITEILNHNWIGAAIGLAGIIIGTILTLSLRPRPRLAVQFNTLYLVGPNAALPDGIEFLFKGNKVPKVTLSRIALWNIGNTTISGDQIVGSDPLRIVVSENGSVLETSILHRTRQANDVVCILRPNTEGEVECRFDYLDPQDGALIQIIHTGTSRLGVLGTLRGLPKGVLRLETPQQETRMQPRQFSPFVGKLVGLAIGLIGLVLSVAALRGTADWPELAAGVFIMSVSALMMIGFGLLPPRDLSPNISSNEPGKAWWQFGTR